MKKIVLGMIIGVSIMMELSMIKQKDVPVYNRIKDDELILCIEDFVRRGKGTHIDSVSKFLYLEPYMRQEDGKLLDYDCWRLTYMEDIDHIYYQGPVIICEQIAGKKIILGVPVSYSLIAQTKIPDMGEYFKSDLPEEYRKFKLKSQNEKNLEDRIYRLIYNYGKRELIIKYDKNRLIDTTYRNYNNVHAK